MTRMIARTYVDDVAIAVLEGNVFSRADVSRSSFEYPAAKRARQFYWSRLEVR